jgi:hypothetical protein
VEFFLSALKLLAQCGLMSEIEHAGLSDKRAPWTCTPADPGWPPIFFTRPALHFIHVRRSATI